MVVSSHSASFVESIIALGLLFAQSSFRHPHGSPLCEVLVLQDVGFAFANPVGDSTFTRLFVVSIDR